MGVKRPADAPLKWWQSSYLASVIMSILHNLPNPNYGLFVGRESEISECIRVLQPYPKSQIAVITIDGMGGVGKTALALRVAHHYLHGSPELPEDERFEAIVWASAKENVLTPTGILHRPQVLNTLEDIRSTILSVTQKERFGTEVEHNTVSNALTRRRTLLIIDNLETVDDESVLTFLRELPAPTKAIVTTRHRIDVAYPIRLTGLSWEEASTLIEYECHLKSVAISPNLGKQLYERTGGVPLAIVWSIGLMSLGKDPTHVIHELGNADGDVARFSFGESVFHIRGNSSHKLLMTLAYSTEPLSREELGYLSGLPTKDRDDGLYQLERLSLANRKGNTFHILPLVREFGQSELQVYRGVREDLDFRWQQRFSLARILPREAEWWKGDASEGVSAAIGLTPQGGFHHYSIGSGANTHSLILGATGTGKTTLITALLCSLCSRYSPQHLQILLIDPKGELNVFTEHKLPHLLYSRKDEQTSSAVEETEKIMASRLLEVKQELSRRMQQFQEIGASNFSSYRDSLPRILVVIDEASYMPWGPTTEPILDVARRGRAFGIHLLLSTQTMSGIDQTILANVSVRMFAGQPSKEWGLEVYGEDQQLLTGQVLYLDYLNNPSGTVVQVAYSREEELSRFFDRITELNGTVDAPKTPPLG